MALRLLDLENPERIQSLLSLQRRKAFDLEADFDWGAPIDASLPLLPLAAVDRMFPGLDPDEQVALSQLFGIVIAAIFSDAEQFLNRAREALWPDFERLFAAHPDLLALGTQFFDEERKHAEMFRRYIVRWLDARGLDPVRFFESKPSFAESWQHRVILRNAAGGGLAFWWIVLLAEEESPLIYRTLEQAPEQIEPLYLRIHRKHFEEEARHATFAYTAMDLLAASMTPMRRAWHRRADVVLCQMLQWSFLLGALRKQRGAMREGPDHPFLRSVARAMAKVEKLPLRHLFRVLLREPTIASPFLNFRFHESMVAMAGKHRLWTMPLPAIAAVSPDPAAP